MQVYVVVRNDSNKMILIAQKRQFNSFWGKKRARYASIVNQAGQFCLPGGRVEKTDLSYTATAIREFKEETGVDLESYAGVSFREFQLAEGFVVVEALVCLGHVFEMENAANNNLQPGQYGKPAGSGVVDWELSRVIAISDSVATHYLGSRLDVDDRIDINHYRQSIDWYGWVAEYYDQL